MVITGTGRAGTTYLVQLLTHLGLDTGFKNEGFTKKIASSLNFREARGGFEQDIVNSQSPYIIKDPAFCQYADEIFRNESIEIEHIFIPIRELYAAAESRRRVTLAARNRLPRYKRLMKKFTSSYPKASGGLWGVSSTRAGVQESYLSNMLYELMLATSKTNVPITLINYPYCLEDSQYLFNKLTPILKDIDYQTFRLSFEEITNPKISHSFEKKDR